MGAGSNEYATFRVGRRRGEPFLRFLLDGLGAAGCRVIFASPPFEVPFRITFETAFGARMGVVAYPVPATRTLGAARPGDEHRVETCFGSELWLDPSGLSTTLLLGVGSERGFFVSFDPVLTARNEPRGDCIVPAEVVAEVDSRGWSAWEWEPEEGCVQTVIGLASDRVLHCVHFETAALGLDPGHRHLLAERFPWSLRRRSPTDRAERQRLRAARP